MTLREFLAQMKDAPTIGKTQFHVGRHGKERVYSYGILGIAETSYERGIPKYVLAKLRGKVFDRDKTEVIINVEDNIIEIIRGAYWERPHYHLRFCMEPPETRFRIEPPETRI